MLTSFFHNVYGQCGPTNVDANPLGSAYCEGDTASISFQSYGTCAGTYEYQVMDGAAVVQPWSTTSNFTIIPSATVTYTLQSRCTSCPSTVIADTFLIEFVPAPTITGDTFICHGTATNFVATGSNGAIEWWSAPTGGTQLSADSAYTTPTLTSDQTYYANVTSSITSGTGQGQVLITECGLAGFQPGADNDYIEISNLYSTPVNTTGWKVVVSNSYSNINTYNSTIWNLPTSFAPCSILSKTDISGSANYWGSNILWNPSLEGWAMILDNNWDVVDFVCWGWTPAELAAFAPVILGNPITLGAQWTGPACPSACGSTAAPASISRFGGTDNNNSGDFVCQPTSLNVLNPGLPCGWTASSITCPFPVNVVIDMPPTASNLSPINVECAADVPAPDISDVDDEADDYTSAPTVTHLSDVSNGNTCPEVITRTYRIADSCSNYIDVTQTITINDVTAPVFDTPPANVTVECPQDVPVMTNLGWTDNCDGSGTVQGTDVSDGNTCPEIITRTWTYTDNCGNTSNVSQTITIHDQTPPNTNDLLPVQLVSLPNPDPSLVTATDNCGTPNVVFFSDSSDGGFCPETVVRTYRVTDACNNENYATQIFTIGDPIPNASFVASSALLNNLDTEVEFTNTSSGAVSYIWDFGDLSGTSNEEHPIHVFPDEESGGYIVELIAVSPFGCTDTVTMVIKVKEELIYYIPNSFTPDGDEYNQTFQPVFTSGFDPYDFEMLIYNRWGEVIFETHDATVGWDGTFNGKYVPAGTYVYTIRFKVEDVDDRHELTGHVSILK